MAAKKKKAAGPVPVESIVHDDRRTNIPTADAHDLVTPEIEKVESLRYPRNPDLDPQLVWKGKDQQDSSDLVVDVPPIYIQEKIDPRVLIENLRDTALKPDDEPELKLFETFDDLDDMAAVEFYQHESKWSNRMILGDSLQVMASLAERERLRGKVQMIYIDPPYGIKFGSNWQVSMRERDVKDTRENIAREVEVVKAFRDTWELGVDSYLSYLRDRLAIARDLLTNTGSIFVQIGDENAHRVRCLLDEVFGDKNFVSQISFKTKMALGNSRLPNVFDHIMWYAKEKDSMSYFPLYQEKRVDRDSLFSHVEEPGGVRRRAKDSDYEASGDLKAGLRAFRYIDMTSAGNTPSCVFEVEIDGKRVWPKSGKSWKTNREGMARLKIARRLALQGNSLSYVLYYDDFPMQALLNVWTDTRAANERVYVVQTSTTVVERCMHMCTRPGDLVVDPTCGSGTTAIAAEKWGRRWITVDSSRVALAIAKQRLVSTQYPFFEIRNIGNGNSTEVGGQPRLSNGFVNKLLPYVTLGSIAQNPSIFEDSDWDTIQGAIERNTEFREIIDSPTVSQGTIRVSGPFTIESLSPHRSLGFVMHVDDTEDPAMESAEEFNSMILENLDKAGIQNGLKSERLEFESVDAYAGVCVNAIGTEKTESGEGGKKIALSVGPQYGTVSATYVKEATREAQQIEGVSVLAILGFAFDPNVVSLGDDVEVVDDAVAAVAKETRLGKLSVVMVRMNTDLLMGDELKKTGAGNLFVVSGEPDIEISSKGDQIVVDIKGVDVYDPNIDRVRSRGTDQIALWMIDTNYNGESFFVRHCYFPGGYDWYKSLKRALKAEIDEATWDTLNKTTSRPFAKPETGKIAVKVINDYGDEVMKVIEVV